MKTFNKKVAIATMVGVAGLLSACGSGSNTGGQNKVDDVKNQPNLQSGFFLLQPGAGYDTSTHTAVSNQSCLSAAQNPANIEIADPHAYIHMGNNVDLSMLEKQLGVSVGGGVGLGGGVFSGSMQADYLENAQNTNYKLNLIYLYAYGGDAIFKQGTVGEGPNALTPYARSLAFGGSPTRFRQMCGNSYVAQMKAGALLSTVITLKFKSEVDKEAFNAALNLNVGIVDVAARIEQAAKTSKTSVRMTMSALQVGGEPQKLNDIFGKPGTNGNYPYINCGSVESTAPQEQQCKKMMTDILTYAQTMKTQLTPQNLYYLEPLVQPYSSIGVTPNLPHPSKQVLQSAQNLYNMYESATFDSQFVDHYLNILQGNLSTGSVVALTDAQKYYQKQFEEVFQNSSYHIMDCFRGYISESCPQIEANVKAALADYQVPTQEKALIDYFETSIYKGKLLTYIGKGTDTLADYALTQNPCVFYPVSTQASDKYVVACTEGLIFPVKTGLFGTGLTITQSPAAGGGVALDVSGLDYTAINPDYPAYQPKISYPNSFSLKQNSFDNEQFKTDGLNIKFGGLAVTHGILKMTQIPKGDN